jgi:hypothetical protein
MKPVFIAAEGPIRVVDAHTGAIVNMTAERRGCVMAGHWQVNLAGARPGTERG